MSSDSENFEPLRRLLTLKRHEQPPPGYFNRFSRDVISRIRAGDQGQATGEVSWFQKFWGMLDAKPVFAGAFGAAVCAVVISGILISEDPGAPSAALPVAAAAPAFEAAAGAPMNISAQYPAQLTAGTNSSVQDLFNQIQIKATPASWTLPLPQSN